MGILQIFFRVLRLGRVERGIFAFIAGSALVVACAQIAESVIFGRLIDALANDTSFTHYLMIWFPVVALNMTVSIALTVIADRLSHRHRLRTMDGAFEKAVQKPISHFSKDGTGKTLRTILNGTDQVFWVTVSFLMGNMTAIFGILIVVPIAFMLDARLAGLLLGLALAYAAGSLFVVRTTHKKQERVDNRHHELTARIVDVLANVAVIRSFNRRRAEASLFRDLTRGTLIEQYPVLNWWGAFNLITRLSSMLAMFAIVAVGASLVHRGLSTPGEIITFVGFSSLLIGRLDQLSGAFNRVVGQAPILRNLFELLDGPPPAQDLGDRRLPHATPGHVRFDNVSFRYGPEGAGVTDLSFEVMPGETVALVGASGAGKTTTLALLQRILVPESGAITIDGVDLQDLNLENLCENIATVFQDPGLFNRSIYDNIEVGKPSATRTEIESAARRADALDFILDRPEGFDFKVGERGAALSGGERQRIAIARAILKEAPILILDEATSALDNESERKVQAAMTEMRKARTTLVIAHRLSTIVSADRVLVFSGGHIVESGKFRELQRAHGAFARLLKAGQIAEIQNGGPEL